MLVNALCVSGELGCALRLSSVPWPLQECLKEQPCLEAGFNVGLDASSTRFCAPAVVLKRMCSVLCYYSLFVCNHLGSSETNPAAQLTPAVCGVSCNDKRLKNPFSFLVYLYDMSL